MKKYKDHTVSEYLKVLSEKTPVPGGGSAAALSAALGAALISMVTNYSLGKSDSRIVEAKLRKILAQSEKIRKRLLDLVDLDAQVYLKVVAARKSSAVIKRKALKQAQNVPLEVCRLCFSAVALTPFLVEKGNKYLLSDVEVALELLLSSFNSALVNYKINQ